MSSINRNKIVQLGILVWDLKSTAKAWQDFLGIEPEWGKTKEYEITGATYKSNPCYGIIEQAFFNLDNIQIELIAPLNEKPSFWLNCLKKNGEGLHHIAFLTNDTQDSIKELSKKNDSVVQYGYGSDKTKKGKYTYIDTLKDLKVILELLEC